MSIGSSLMGVEDAMVQVQVSVIRRRKMEREKWEKITDGSDLG